MSGDVIAMPDRFTKAWEVHEHPGRPLDEGAVLCFCVTCESRRRHREMLAELRVWALERGRPADLDLVALILAAKERGPDDGPLGLWTRTGVNRCLSVDTFNWCSLGQVLYPDGVPGALWLFLDFLAETGRLERASDPLDELRKPLICYGGLDRSGRERTEGRARRRPLIRPVRVLRPI